MEVVVKNEEQVELSFTRMWDPSLKGNFVPLNIDKRYLFTSAHLVISRFQSMTTNFLIRTTNVMYNYIFIFRFVMLRGSSGFYSYAIYERLANWPAFSMDTTRIALKLRKDK